MILPSGRIRSAVPNARLLAGHSLIDVPARDQLPGGRNFYWPTSLTTAVDPVSGKEVILLFLAQMFDPNLAADGRRDVAWTFAQVSSRLAAYSLAPDGRLTFLSLTRTPMPALTRDGIGWGAGTFVTSGYLYVFGSRRPTDVPMAWGSDYYLARVPLASRSTLAAWRFWTGAGWATKPSRAAVVIPYTCGVESTIAARRDPITREFTFVFKEFAIIGSRVLRGRSTLPTGPWIIDPTPVAEIAPFDATDMSYSAYEVPLGGGGVGTIISHGNLAPSTPTERLGIFALT